jgi:N-acetylglucosaminyldiphosphoundecaprenol N-acetyl-beta-D-mannosaminyltransferase
MTKLLLGYHISYKLPNFFTNKQLIVNTINPHSYSTAKHDHEFKRALQNSDCLLPDGIGIIWALRILNKTKAKRITGSDLHKHLLEHAQQNKLKVFYLGAKAQTLALIKYNVEVNYPGVESDSYSPPFKAEFSESDNLEMIQKINSFQPDILFVGMTAPKQEKWINSNKKHLNACIICTIGAVFDFYAGTVKRPNKIIKKIGLEWFFRFIREPRRLWKRNLISLPIFISDVIVAKMSILFKF